MARPAIFLDRDGVINENRSDYVKSWEEVIFLPGAIEAIRRLNTSEYAIVMVTNQSAVGRGIVPFELAQAINRQVVEQITAAGGRVDAWYMCPHHPQQGCECRKPAPGLLLQAQRDLSLDLARSYMIGDAYSDLQAAQAAGVRATLVLTGRGAEQLDEIRSTSNLRYAVAADIGTAIDQILRGRWHAQPSTSQPTNAGNAGSMQ